MYLTGDSFFNYSVSPYPRVALRRVFDTTDEIMQLVSRNSRDNTHVCLISNVSILTGSLCQFRHAFLVKYSIVSR